MKFLIIGSEGPCAKSIRYYVPDAEIKFGGVSEDGWITVRDHMYYDGNTFKDHVSANESAKYGVFREGAIATYRERGHFCELLRGPIGVELGVADGRHAKLLLERCEGLKELWLVDNWLGECKIQDPRIRRWQGDSVSFLKQFQGRANWVYIDTSHYYTQTKMEIAAAQKITDLVCGHDFVNVDGWGVVQAVLESGWPVVAISNTEYAEYAICNNRYR